MALVRRNPKTFDEALATLNSEPLVVALRAVGMRPCPSPTWDTGRTYRVVLAAGRPEIQRYRNNQWEPAPLQAPEEPREGSEQAEGRAAVKAVELFVSHSSKDAELAKALTRLIDVYLDVPSYVLRCTSVAGYVLEPGANVADELRRNLESTIVVLGLLTESSVESSYVLMELGAAWGLKRHVIPLTIGNVYRRVPGPIGSDLHVVDLSDEARVVSMLDTIQNRCGWQLRGDGAGRHTAVKDFVAFVATKAARTADTSATAVPVQQPDADEISDDLAFLEDYLDHLKALDEALDKLRIREKENRRGRASPDELTLLRGARDGNVAFLEENILRAHELVKRIADRDADWEGPHFRSGLGMQAQADVRAVIGGLKARAKVTSK